MVPTMTSDLRADCGALQSILPANRRAEMNLMHEVLARAGSWEHQSARHPREHELARQMIVARAQRSARWAERVAAYAARRASTRRERAEMFASGLR